MKINEINSKSTSRVPENFIERMEYDASGNVIYYGQAISGTQESDSAWIIKKITYSNNNPTKTDLAKGAWSDRAILSYS